jgi:penicillin-binding protein 2
LEKGAIKPQELLYCGGTLRVGDRVYTCFEGKSHGYINMKEALQHSCNIYFYQLGLRLGIGSLASFSRQFDLGEITGIDLKGEKKGLVPDPWWKRVWRGKIWYPGDTVNMSIGQGYLLVTPLQMANLMSVIANGGTLFRPHLLKRIVSPKGEVIMEFKPQRIKLLSLKPKNLKILREGLRLVVSKGTGWRADLPFVEVAGKTGTAQNSRKREDHSWFIGYAPFNSPRVALVVLVEHGGEGGKTAAPIAGEILRAIFENV